MFNYLPSDHTFYNVYFMSTKSTSLFEKSRLIQILLELWYNIIYYYQFVIGKFYKLKNSQSGEKPAVLLIQGYLGTTLSWSKVRKKLIEDGHPVYVISLGFQVGSISKKSLKVEKYIEKHNLNNFILVCHSMGGLIGLGLSKQTHQKIIKSVIIGSPLKGTYMAYLEPFFIATWQMMPNSNFIKALQKNSFPNANMKIIYAKFDEIIVPTKFCSLGLEDEHLFNAIGHCNLIMSEAGSSFVLNKIREI